MTFSTDRRDRSFIRAAPLLVAAATAAVFFRAVRFEFLNWDDQPYLVQNLFFRGLDWPHLRWMFTTVLSGPYQPLSWLSYAVDYSVWGMSPFGFHLTNVLLHAANAALFCVLARRLLSSAFAPEGEGPEISLAAAWAALLFSVHPLRAESVAWVTERRDVLSGFFYLLTLLFYLSSLAAPSPAAARRRRAASWTAYALSLASKAIGVGLPLTLLALDFYPLRRRFDRALWREKAPYVGLAVAAGLAGVWAQNRAGALLPIDRSWLSRCAHAAYALAFYPWKTLFPIGLIPFYELPLTRELWHWTHVLSAIVVASALAAAALGRRRWPAVSSACLHYAAAAVPIVGFVRFGPQIAADRYSYLSCLAWPLLAAGGFIWLWRGPLSRRRGSLASAAAALTALLAFACFRQTGIWRDSVVLWAHTAKVVPDMPLARNNLAVALASRGRTDEAISQLRLAVELDPAYADARNNLASQLDSKGDHDEASRQYWTAMWLAPNAPESYTNLGLNFAARRDWDRAEFLFGQAVLLAPRDSQAHSRFGAVLAAKGLGTQARAEFETALRLDPGNSSARAALGLP